jgi:hypothetical protein
MLAARMAKEPRPMLKLSDPQLVVLATACQRADGYVFPVTLKAKGNAIGNVLKSLLAKGMIEEIPGRADDTIWRYDDEGDPITLRATDAGFEALGIERGAAAAETDGGEPAAEAPKPGKKRASRAKAKPPAPSAPTADAPRKPREDSKQSRLIAMLRAPDGATVPEIATALAWRHHTVRGAIAGALKKKLGLTVTSEKVEGRGRVYKLTK